MSTAPSAQSSPIRVCVVTEYFNPDGVGGTPSVIPDLCRQIQQHHPTCRLEVLTSRNVYRSRAERLPRDEIWEGIPVRRMGTPKSNRNSTALRVLAGTAFAGAALLNLLRGPRYDLVFVGTNPPPAVGAALVLRRLRGIPYVYLIHDLFPDIAISLGSMAPHGAVSNSCRKLQAGWLSGASQVVAIGRCMKEHLVESYGIDDDGVAVIPNWADPEVIRPGMKSSSFREQNKLEGLVVLYAGNFGQYQDLDTILDAAKKIAAQGYDATIVLLGNGVRENHLRDRVRKENLLNVRILAPVSKGEYSSALAAADVCLVTLHPDSVGLGVPSKFYGMLAAGRPVIAIVPSESELARVIDEEHCGLRVEPQGSLALANAITFLLSSPADAEYMGRRAREALVNRFTLEAAAYAFVRVFESAARLSMPITNRHRHRADAPKQ